MLRDEMDEDFDDIHEGKLVEDEHDLDELPIDAIDGLENFADFDEDEDDDF